jgi:hypothetical protein
VEEVTTAVERVGERTGAPQIAADDFAAVDRCHRTACERAYPIAGSKKRT